MSTRIQQQRSSILLAHYFALLLLLCATTRTTRAHLIPNLWPKCSAGYCERLDNNACISCSDDKAIKICNFADCRPRRQRSLKDVATVLLLSSSSDDDDDDADAAMGEQYNKIMDKCGSGVPYDTFLYVDSHLFATAVPQNSDINKNEDCPILVVHALFENKNEPGRKEIRMFQSNAINDYYSLFPAEHSVYMGTFELSQLADAYNHTHIDSNSEYNVWNNNCGSFLVQLASQLNVQIDAKVTAFVARRLLEESSKAWIDTLRDTMNGSSRQQQQQQRNLRMMEEEASDEQIVEWLVDSQASHLY